MFFTVLTLALLLNFFSLSFYQKYCPNLLCGAGALIKSEAPKKTPDGPKMGGSGEKTPAPEH